MKKTKIIISVILVLCLTICFAGCSSNHNEDSLKDNLIDGWDNWMQSFSRHALTKNKNLQGEREKGVDEYTGSYSAEYDGFNGEERTISDESADDVYNLTLSAGDNYIVCKGEKFSGSLELTVNDAKK